MKVEHRVYENGKLVNVQETDIDPAIPNQAIIEQREDDTVGALRAYISTPSPTNAQTVAAVRLLCRLALGRWRIRRNRLDDIDGE